MSFAPWPPRRRWVAGGALAGLLAVGAGWARAATDPPPAIPAGDLYQVRPATLASTLTTTGTVEAQAELQLAFVTGGTLKTVAAQIGEHVQAGQVLATLDDAAQQAALQQAQAGVQVATGQAAQAQAQLRQVLQGPTAATVAAAQAQVAQAATALQAAQASAQAAVEAYNDRTAEATQVVQAQNAVNEALTALKTAEQTQSAQQAAAEQALAAAQKKLATDQANLATDQQEYGNITLQQVQQADQQYLSELADFQAWQSGSYPGVNPYAGPLQADATIYQNLANGYYTLQQAQEAVQADQAAVAQAQAQLNTLNTAVAQAQANYAAAEKNLEQAQAIYNDRTPQQQQLVAAQNAVAEAQSALKTAQAEAAAQTQPATPAAIQAAQAAVLTATAEVAAAQAQVQAATVAVNNTVLRAPAAGIITAAPDHPGDTVGAGTPVFTLDTDQLQVALAVSEAQLPALQVGDRLTFTVPEQPGHTYTGRILQTYPTPVPGNGNTYKVVALLTQSAGLKPGMTGSAVIHLGPQARALTVPPPALVSLAGHPGVYVVTGSAAASSGSVPVSAVHWVPVVVGRSTPDAVTIRHGLRPGMWVVLGEGKFFVP